jgi:hypothetical protein
MTANFPSLTPSSRTYTPGIYPHANLRTLGGKSTQVRHSNNAVGDRLSLTFKAADSLTLVAIRQHFIKAGGLFSIFDLPLALWSGTPEPSYAGGRWKYASSPSVVDVSCGIYNITVELETVSEVEGERPIPIGWLFEFLPSEFSSLDTPSFPNFTAYGFSSSLKTSFVRDWQISGERHHLLNQSSSTLPEATYLPNGGPIFRGQEEDCMSLTIGNSGFSRWTWFAGRYPGTPGPGDYRDIPFQQPFAGFTVEWDYFTTVPLETRAIQLFFNVALFSSVDTGLFCSLYAFIEQYSDGFYYLFEASRNPFGSGGEVFFTQEYTEDLFVMSVETWHRFSYTFDPGAEEVYLHIDGNLIVVLPASSTVFPPSIDRFYVEHLVDTRDAGFEVRLSRMRFLEVPVYTAENYTPRSMRRSPYPLNP